MARADHRQRVAAHGTADRAGQRGVAQLAGQLAVAGRLAVGDAVQQRPHALLERVAGGDVRRSKAVRSPDRYSAELALGRLEAVVAARAERRPVRSRPVAGVVDAREHAIGRDERQLSHGGLDDRVRCGHVRRTVSGRLS